MASSDRELRKKAIGNLLKLAGQAMGNKLQAKKAPPPKAPEPEAKKEDELEDEDARKLIELYEAKEAATPEA